ncbi:hypothetical protein I4F81_004885 [Pyropia yezoensis]|uniref:Uncharacterized protein n=1 Tax=Pyropia yezoensis TaxID=2788 RepID=A0ACC3BXV8_PYRYE|nr:hypothetical protein I4F81_004885 [Neopyropia yezoensis]
MGVAREAIDALVAVGDDRGIPPLLAAAAAVGGQPAVRASAANAAAMLGASPRAPRGTAKSVAAALGRLAADAATPDDVRDTATVAGAAVAAAAAAMPPPPGLAHALDDDGSWLVRAAAAISLGGLPQAVAGSGSGDIEDGAASVGLTAQGAPASAAVVDALVAATAVWGVSGVRRGEEGVQRQAVTALGFLGVPEAVPVFERLVAPNGRGGTKMMCYRVAGALRGVRTPRALALARKLSTDEVGYVADMAATTVAELEEAGTTAAEA